MTERKRKKTPMERLQKTYDEAKEINPGRAGMLLIEAKDRLSRLVRENEALPQEYERVEIIPDDGPALSFSAKELRMWSTKRDGSEDWYNCALWQTMAGAYVAISEHVMDFGDRSYISALVLEADEDEFARRSAVMDHFRWSNQARYMAEKLGWTMIVEVD